MTYKHFTDRYRETKAVLEMDVITLNQRLQQELAETGRVDNIQIEIFEWIDALTPSETNCLRQIYVVLENQGKLPDNSLLKDIISYTKYKQETILSTDKK